MLAVQKWINRQVLCFIYSPRFSMYFVCFWYEPFSSSLNELRLPLVSFSFLIFAIYRCGSAQRAQSIRKHWVRKKIAEQKRQDNTQKQQHNMFASFIYLFAYFFSSFLFGLSPSSSMMGCGDVWYRFVPIAHAVRCVSIFQEICFAKDDWRDKRKHIHTHTHACSGNWSPYKQIEASICCVRNIGCELNGAQINHMAYLDVSRVPRNWKQRRKRVEKIHAFAVAACRTFWNFHANTAWHSLQQLVVVPATLPLIDIKHYID